MKIDYTVLIDTREKELKHITDKFKANNIKFEHKKLVVGDYRICLDSEGSAYTPPVVIERKANLSELIGNLTSSRDKDGKTRLHRELDRAAAMQTKVIIMIECERWYEQLLNGVFISKVHPNSARGLILSLEAKYPNVSIVGVSKELSASYINSVLYYHLRQELKRFKETGTWEL